MANMFKTGDVVQHFKRMLLPDKVLFETPHAYLYIVLGYGKHTETHEEFVVYAALYSMGDVHINDIYIRPKEMFESPVDKEKYPEARQYYRFEKIPDTSIQKMFLKEVLLNSALKENNDYLLNELCERCR